MGKNMKAAEAGHDNGEVLDVHNVNGQVVGVEYEEPSTGSPVEAEASSFAEFAAKRAARAATAPVVAAVPFAEFVATGGNSVAPAPSEAFDPGTHTVDEVRAYIAGHPDERDAVLTAEAAGKARSTLLAAAE